MSKTREGDHRLRLLLCGGTACASDKAFQIKAAVEDELKKHGLQDDVLVSVGGCGGHCAVGPVMAVMPDGILYHNLTEGNVPHLVEEHFLNGRPVVPLVLRPTDTAEAAIPTLSDSGFFARQTLVTLSNCGLINPEKIDEYIARDGYRGVAKALTEMTPEDVVEAIRKSGLRGRGGGGFPTGIKWDLCAKAPGDVKYVVCNADEGDPGAYMDRSIIESDPHAVLEGMLLGAYAIGAREGFVYIREEYPLARQRLEIAIGQAREYGLLGDDVFGTGFGFDLHIKQGAGAFVCGEETSLIASIEGAAPEPRQRPPYPAEAGLWGRPTNINNVETWATVPRIIRKGADWYAGMGTEKSKGTKVFSLVGKIRNTGLIEVEMGMTLRDIIFEIGGGIPDDKQFKAVQTGGPSGGCIPASLLDLPVDYEKLMEVGSIMGSGGMIVMDEETCVVDVARFFLEFTTDESCGKCLTCRDGAAALLGILTRICNGEGQEGDLVLLEELCDAVKSASMCGLGQTLPNPVLSTLKTFREEYEAHILDRRCPAGVCKSLISFHIDPEACKGCGVCARNCPSEAITGVRKSPYTIDQTKCTKCAICQEACKVFGIGAVRVE